jgi:hypothetical protein
MKRNEMERKGKEIQGNERLDVARKGMEMHVKT